jgi:hypothetical protein
MRGENHPHKLIMPWLDHGILFPAIKEDPRITSGGDEKSAGPLWIAGTAAA